MEYRRLPHGNENEKFSVIGLGLGGIGTTPLDEIKPYCGPVLIVHGFSKKHDTIAIAHLRRFAGRNAE